MGLALSSILSSMPLAKGLLDIDFSNHALYPIGTMSNAAFLAAGGMSHTGTALPTIVAGGLAVPSIASDDVFFLAQADVASRLVVSGRVNLELQFVPAFSSNGNGMILLQQGATTNNMRVVGANGSLRATVVGDNQDSGAVSGTLFGSYWSNGDTMKLFIGAGGNLALEGASSDNAVISHATGPVQTGSWPTNVDYKFFAPDGALVCSRIKAYALGTKPSWVP